MWKVLISPNHMRGRRTDMGHAEYAAGGVDKRKASKSPFGDIEEIYSFDPMEEYGEIKISKMAKEFEEAYSNNCKAWPECVNCSGVYITMFSGFIAAFGWENMLMAAGYDPKAFGEMAGRWERWIFQFFQAFAASNVPVMMCHDDICWTSGPVLAPAWYREYVFPAYKRMWQLVIDSGKKVLFTSDGNYTKFIDDVAQAGAHGFVLEPTTDMTYIAEKYGETHVFIGNADTRILLSGTKADIRDEVKRCMDIGKDCPGFFMAVGNHIPANTPVENGLYYNEAYKELLKR